MDYYPRIDELLYIFAFVSLLLLFGEIIKFIFMQKKEEPKFSVILVIWLVILVSYVLFSGYMYLRTEPSRSLTVLGWCLLFWLIPLFYYSLLLVNAMSNRVAEQIGPMGVKIEDPSPFASARKLALMGDIDGAIALYRSYKTNQVEALFEAFRLLKSKGRYEEALHVLQEIVDKYPDKPEAWVEAKYYQAKIKANIFQQYSEAIQLYKQILRKRARTPFQSIASNEIVRLQAILKTSGKIDESADGDGKEMKKETELEEEKAEEAEVLPKKEKKRYVLAIEDTLFGTYVPPDPFYKDKKEVDGEVKEQEAKQIVKKKTKDKISKKKVSKKDSSLQDGKNIKKKNAISQKKQSKNTSKKKG